MTVPRMNLHIEMTADVDDSAELGGGTRVWHLAQIREDAVIGRNCTIGRGAYIGRGVRVGDNVKIQNYALVYEPAILADGTFIGPAAVLTNDPRPRAIKPDGSPKRSGDWQPTGVQVEEGASIGAQAVCVAPVKIGRWSLVAAGAVVVAEVSDFTLVAGNPARVVGWIGKTGERLIPEGRNRWRCPVTGEPFRQIADRMCDEAR